MSYRFEVFEFPDGSVGLSCGGGGMEQDLVFACRAMRGDPDLVEQRRLVEHLAKAGNAEPGGPQ